MKNILIINQSSELYGADKVLLELLENFPKGYNPVVVLENEGVLKNILIDKGIKVIKCPVIKLKKSYLNFLGIFIVLRDILKSIYLLNKNTKNLKIDLIQSNASSVFLGAFYSFFFRKKHLWHVHEIVENPKIIANLYPKIVNFFSDKIIFNSKTSYNHFIKLQPKIIKKSEIIYNGQTRNIPITDILQINDIKKNIFKAKPNNLIIGLIGRIYERKGQLLLLESFKNLLNEYNNIHLVFVGCTPEGHENFAEKLNDTIKNYNLNNKVTIIDFQEDIWKIYDSIDISVVPSIEPETFGLVATESMLSNKPVVASKIGGVVEVIEDNVTGYLFENNNPIDLKDKLELLVKNFDLRKKLGENGLKRVKEDFSTQKFMEGFKNIYAQMLR